jgi:hypothetical protein
MDASVFIESYRQIIPYIRYSQACLTANAMGVNEAGDGLPTDLIQTQEYDHG